jgi:hypothetical protein
MEDGNGKGMEWIGKWGSGNVGMECGREMEREWSG